jgi:hypothetical protein
MREKNKAIIEAIRNELSKCDGSAPVEILVKFINHGRIEYGVLKYWMNLSGDWMGAMGSMFDFDFFSVREVIGFVKFDNVMDVMYKNGVEFKTE